VTGTAGGGIGGLVGNCHNYNDSVSGFTSCTVSNCYSTGSVTALSGMNQIGGLVGVSYTVENCYSTSSVTASGCTDVGGLVGNLATGSVSNSYYLDDDVNWIGTHISDANLLRSVDTYTNVTPADAWDFVGTPYNDTGVDDFWAISPTINNGYPYLRDMVP